MLSLTENLSNFAAYLMIMTAFFKKLSSSIKLFLSGLSFRTGVIVLCLCIPCYVFSFAQMALDISSTLKGVLWVIFFGLAKTFQYAGLTIMGVEGVRRLKQWWDTLRRKEVS